MLSEWIKLSPQGVASRRSKYAGCRVPGKDNHLRYVEDGRYIEQYIHDKDLPNVQVTHLRWKEVDDMANPDDTYACHFNRAGSNPPVTQEGSSLRRKQDLDHGWVQDPMSPESYWRWFGCADEGHMHWIRLRRDLHYRGGL